MADSKSKGPGADVADLLMSLGSTVRQVVGCIDQNTRGIALIVDADRKLVSTITDGDVRRAVLDGVPLEEDVGKLLERKAESAYPKPITAAHGTDKATLLELIRKHSIRHIPLLDEQGKVVDLVTADELLPVDVRPMQAVVMAGGYGTRLRPLTENVPKPMLPVGDQPLLERIIRQLRGAGISRVNVTTHYLPEKITDHFGDGRNLDVDLRFVNEDQPLGTAGALSLLEESDEPLLVMNGDILTGLNFRSMLAYHREHEADMTVAVRQYDLEIPYGVLEGDGAVIRAIREKPVYNFFVNAGIYLIEPSVRSYVPVDRPFDMTDLIETLIADGGMVVSFPIVEYWLDIGQVDDYERAQKQARNGRLGT